MIISDKVFILLIGVVVGMGIGISLEYFSNKKKSDKQSFAWDAQMEELAKKHIGTFISNKDTTEVYNTAIGCRVRLNAPSVTGYDPLPLTTGNDNVFIGDKPMNEHMDTFIGVGPMNILIGDKHGSK